jgi:hypothetical protein
MSNTAMIIAFNLLSKLFDFRKSSLNIALPAINIPFTFGKSFVIKHYTANSHVLVT